MPFRVAVDPENNYIYLSRVNAVFLYFKSLFCPIAAFLHSTLLKDESSDSYLWEPYQVVNLFVLLKFFYLQVLFSSMLFLFSYNTSQKPLPLVLTLLAAMATLFCIAYYNAFTTLWHTTDTELAAITGT